MGVKTTVEIADPLFDEAKHEAERSGCTLRELIELGLQRELERRKRAKPFKLRDASVKGAELVGGVRHDDGRAMRAYAYMGTPGMPDTVEAINRLLDDDESSDETKP